MPAKPATSAPAVPGQHGDESEASHTFVPFHNFTGEPFDEDYSKTPQWWDSQEDVVISGISGRFPEAQNIKEFMDNLFEGVDMITEDNRRWDPGYYDLPKRHGKIKDLSKFDAGFFGVHPKQASNMDPQIRMLLETAYEAIYDAGINPHTLRGTKSGIFVGNAASETSSVLINDPETIQGYALTGTTRSMFANRLSYCLDFRGPSFTVDTACSSALLALQVAVDAIRQGQCDQAIVAGAHLTLTPNSALQFLRLGMLSPTGRCQSFDAKGDGYVRSECVGCIFIQKKSTARRIYATIVHAKSNTDGYKEQGITFPSGDQQINLLRGCYKEAGLDPKEITYLEAHGTGTKVGDPQECHAITTVFTRKRDNALLIGSVKSNAGHAEPASGIMSLAKVIIAMETETIPANLHFQEPNPYIPSLTDGRLKVVAENTKWEPGMLGVSSFGFGGSNTHIILKPNQNNKKLIHFDDKKKEIPILLLHSARSQEALENIFTMFEKRSDDLYLYNMLCEQSQTPPNWYNYRGYTIVNRQNPEKLPIREVGKVPNLPKRPIWLVYTGMGSQWAGMGRELMVFDVFREAVMKCSAAIEPFGISPMKLIMEGVDSDFQDNTLNCFMCITSIQIAMTDLMRSIGLKEDGIIGHSTGEMAASYADGCTDYAETMYIAYYRGKTILGAKFPPGGMGAVGLSWSETIKRCPEGVYAACHNAPDSVTVSGDAQKVTDMLNQLASEGVFVKPVNSSGIAFHSPCMQIIADDMRNALLKVLPNPKPRSARWITSSVPDDKLDTDLAKYSSADYHVNNMVSAVLFSTALRKIPENSIVIEVAPHCLLQAILKRGVPTGSQCFGLMSNKLEKHENNMDFFLANLGKIYQAGANFDIQKLYPKVEYPVPRGTPMLSYMFGWDHGHEWEVYTGPLKLLNCVSSFTVDPFASDSKESYVLHHVIDGRVIYPFTGYLVLAWKAICKIRLVDFNKTPVIIENVRVLRATIVTKPVKFDVVVTLANGDFEVLEDGNLCATGRITILDEENNRPFFYENLDNYPMRTKPEDEKVELTTADLYKEYQLRGYEYGPAFRGIQKACNSGETATLLWTGNWVTFIDTLLQTHLVLEKNDTLRVPIRLRLLRIDPARQNAAVEEIDGVKVIRARNNVQTFGAVAGGCEACDLVCQTVPRRSHQQKVTLERISFMPYKQDHCMFEHPEVQKELHSYNDMCRALAINGVKKLLKTGAKLPNKALFEKIASGNLPDVTAEQLEQLAESKDCTLIKLLNDVLNQKPTKEIENFTEHLATTIKSAKTDLENDKLWNFSWTDRPAIDQLDNGFQNTKGHYIKIAVLEPESLHVTKKLHWAANIHPLLETEWLLIGPHVETQFDADERAAAHVQCHEFDIDAEEEMSEMDKEQDMIVLDRVLHRKVDIPKYLAKVKQLVRDDGFVMVNEVTGNFETAFAVEGLQQELPTSHLNGARKYGLYYEHADWCEIFEKAGYWVISWSSEQLMTTLYLLRKIPSYTLDPYYINVDDVKEFSWIEPLQKAIEARLNEPQEKTIVMYSNQVRDNGILGMGLCFREEYKQNRTRSLIDLSFKNRNGPPTLNKDDPAVQDLMKRDLLFNIYRDGVFGNYKHVPLYDEQLYAYEETEHAFINTLTRGDLSTLSWVSSANKYFDAKPQNKQNNLKLASVYYASLNFRDIMLATGRLPPDAIPKAVGIDFDCLLGMEYTGRVNSTGERVMGICPSAQAMGTTCVYDHRFCWGIPEHWTMEQAATVPVAYSTAYYALCVRGRMRKGEKVLIHSGSGGVGIAAITIALAHGCEVFTTVSTDDKKKFLQHRFPQLQDKHICNSRTTEFELHIKQQTMGLGVDIVLNSLSDDKLQASVRCLAQHGRFCEIGKFDLASDTALGMSVFLKNATFHGVLMDSLCSPMEPDWEIAARLLAEGIMNGTVKPLPTTVFDMNKAEEAFRYMAHGKHIGKVMLKIRNEESEVVAMPKPVMVKAVRRTQCHPQHVYILIGGLGGFGLELANWLIVRGAQKVILTGRSGVKTGYQKRYINHWRANGVECKISNLDISDEAQTYQLIKEAQEMGPVGGIFNLGMVLRDTLFENQNVKNFQDTCAPKYYGTQHLDKVTRKMCGDELKWFVVFSSLTAGRGNTGQTSYAFANSAAERIVEQRRHDGISGIVIQWGAIGDVGIIIETMGDNNTVVSGSLPQRIASCMQAMDSFLCLNHPMVTSFVKSEVQSKSGGSDEDVVDAIAHILGVSDPSQLNPDANLGDLGLDSLMGVEIKQALERDYDIVLSMKDIRSLTLTKLRNMAKAGKANKSKAADDPTRQNFQTLSTDDMDRDNTFGYRFRIDFNQVRPDIPCEKINDVTEGSPLFFVHSIEGIGTNLIPLAKQLPYPCYCFQLVPEAPTDTIENLAAFYTKQMKEVQPKGPYRIIGYSYGACIAFDMAIKLQKEFPNDPHIVEPLIMLDGSHHYMRLYRQAYRRFYNVHTEDLRNDPVFETEILVNLLLRFAPLEYKATREQFLKMSSIDERIGTMVDTIYASGYIKDKEVLRYGLQTYWKKMMMGDKYDPKVKFAGDITLVRAKTSAAREEDVGQDYGLSEVTTGSVHTYPVEGDHDTFIHNESAVVCAKHIMNAINNIHP